MIFIDKPERLSKTGTALIGTVGGKLKSRLTVALPEARHTDAASGY